MESVDNLTLESDWLPSTELDRLIGESRHDVPGLSVWMTGESHRGVDPTIAVALISGLVSIVVPFVTKLAERVFAKEPDAVVTIDGAGGGDQVVLTQALSPDVQAQLVKDAIASGALRVRISLDPTSK